MPGNLLWSKTQINLNFSGRMANVSGDVATKRQVGNAFDFGDKRREKNIKTSNVWFKLFYCLNLLW